jgi:hypothetical protein
MVDGRHRARIHQDGGASKHAEPPGPPSVARTGDESVVGRAQPHEAGPGPHRTRVGVQRPGHQAGRAEHLLKEYDIRHRGAASQQPAGEGAAIRAVPPIRGIGHQGALEDVGDGHTNLAACLDGGRSRGSSLRRAVGQLEQDRDEQERGQEEDDAMSEHDGIVISPREARMKVR